MVIPAILRKKMGLKTGDRVLATFDEETETLKIQRAETLDEALEKISSWVSPDIEPLENPRALFNAREPRL
ncbi:MAG: AbrB/MazE/SpoVT family DNA-binding domain-containing protein [Coriobacteriia bacterium]|nr:AbrB/MazE/SpoVT family DNA-binding domain-containing protein [Coriobacteriia bacterium]